MWGGEQIAAFGWICILVLGMIHGASIEKRRGLRRLPAKHSVFIFFVAMVSFLTLVLLIDEVWTDEFDEMGLLSKTIIFAPISYVMGRVAQIVGRT